MEYHSYPDIELLMIMDEPSEVTGRPYLLFTSFALNTLRDLICNEVDDDEEPESIWGKRINKRMLDRILEDIIRDFCDAAVNHTQIPIKGMRYTVRKQNAFDKKRLKDLFSFDCDGDEYIITKEGVNALEGEMYSYCDDFKKDFSKNREYLRKIIMVAEDDENDGWEKLTDMEVAAYCWALYYAKTDFNNDKEFHDKYKSYYGLTLSEVKKGWNDDCQKSGRPFGKYTFSAKNIVKWNEENGQESVIGDVDTEQADNYWYDVAAKGNFKRKEED